MDDLAKCAREKNKPYALGVFSVLLSTINLLIRYLGRFMSNICEIHGCCD